MKRLFVLCALIYSGLLAFPQQECIDVIYVEEENKVLLDCCILEVINRNQVIYYKEGERDTVTARAIIKDGQYIDFIPGLQSKPGQGKSSVYDPDKYNGHTYEHYEKIFNKSKKAQFVGIAFIASGLGMFIAANVKQNQESYSYYSGDKWYKLENAGVLIMNVGIPLFIASSILKSNNRKAMIKINEQKGLALGCNPYGFGLTYTF